MRFASVCSGIEAASVAWESLGFTPAWFSEIAPWPSKFLATRFPGIPNHGSLVGLADRLDGSDRSIDLLVGGTPCQDFSIAGLGAGIDGDRGNLTLEFARLADALRPRWLLWENVPGVLSNKGGRAFASLIRGLQHIGYGLAWRVLDAQFFGVAQRRERVFLVGHLGNAAGAGAVLFEPEGVRRNPPTRREAREEIARTLTAGSGGGRFDKQPMTVLPPHPQTIGALTARAMHSQSADEAGAGQLIAELFNAEGSRGATLTASNASKGVNNQTPLIVASFDETQVTSPTNRSSCAPSPSLTARGRPPAIAFNARQDPVTGAVTGALDTDGGTQAVCITGDRTHALRAEGADASEDGTGRGTPIVNMATSVRRLTPMECERLQGFPDQWTAVNGAKDTPRYFALGNSMAVPVMRWIGRRLLMVDRVLHASREAA